MPIYKVKDNHNQIITAQAGSIQLETITLDTNIPEYILEIKPLSGPTYFHIRKLNLLPEDVVYAYYKTDPAQEFEGNRYFTGEISDLFLESPVGYFSLQIVSTYENIILEDNVVDIQWSNQTFDDNTSSGENIMLQTMSYKV